MHKQLHNRAFILAAEGRKNMKTEIYVKSMGFEFPAVWAFSCPAPMLGYQTCRSAINQ